MTARKKQPWWWSEVAMAEHLRELARIAGSQRALAQRLGVSDAYLCDLLACRRDISAAVAKRLGFERLVVFVKQKDGE